ncbi:MAG TPA: SUMF1/EgtB/PvdO family nonheme iron enzyme [Polyangiaceae bacterium]
MSKPTSPTARRRLMLAFWAVVAALVVAAAVKVVRQGALLPPAPAPAPVRSSVPPAPSGGTAPSASVSAALEQLPPLIDENPDTVEAQREVLFRNMQAQLGLTGEAMAKTRAIFADSRWMGQGNPKITKHPMTRAECLAVRATAKLRPADARCGAPNMVAVFAPAAGESPGSAKLCVDQYEYPNIACDYPVSWVKSDQAQLLCQAQGKRLCDAHEWEGACAGALHPPEAEYTFGERRLQQEYLHNKSREIVWAYGRKENQALCGTGSSKSPKCYAPSWEECGTNSYPAGAFPECVSPFGVYDQHGNVAEHMNLPLVAEELGSRGGTGENEMKGSWFIFQQLNAHEDDCRWRALAWHAGRLMADDAHRNYHLGFRCCKDL